MSVRATVRPTSENIFRLYNSLAQIGFSAAGVTDRRRVQIGAAHHAQTPRRADEHPESKAVGQ
jgi:hypothetical protein